MAPEEQRPGDAAESSGLSRTTVIAAAQAAIDESGVDALSMRAVAERLGVKAASLYWHFRDKDQLLDAVVAALLDRARVPAGGDWRSRITTATAQLARELAGRHEAVTLVLGRLAEVRRSRLTGEIAQVLPGSGVAGADAAALSIVVEAVLVASPPAPGPPRLLPDQVMRLEIDSGSWRVQVRAGRFDAPEAATPVGSGRGGPFVESRGDDTIVVRNWRGGNRGAVELNPRYRWLVKVHSGAWNTTLDLSGLRLSGVDVDSGTGNIACTLPAPEGVVPVAINSGIIGVSLRRPRGTAARALVHSGCFRVRFDESSIRATGADVRWESDGAASAANCYDVTVHSGCVKVSMDGSAPARAAPPPPAPEPSPGDSADAPSALELLLDGIEHHVKLGSSRS